jgi:hypothetical protein
MTDAPAKYKTAGTLMMVAGILNLITGASLTVIVFIYALITTLATFGIGIFCFAGVCWPLLPMAFGVVEIMSGYKAMNGQYVPNVRNYSIGGIVVAVLNFSMIPMVLEIIALMSYNDPEVGGWLESQAQSQIS